MVVSCRLKCKGFTLAEVLVTLGILGVIAALVIPTLMKSVPNNNWVMFRKSYSILESAVHNVVNDDSNYPYTQTAITTDGTNTSVMRGLNYTTATGNGSVNKFCFYLTDQLNTVGSVYCPPATGDARWGWSPGQSATFTTTDGVSWKLYFRNSDDDPNNQFPLAPSMSYSAQPVYPVLAYIDVNGSSKGPNCTASTFGSGLAATCASTSDCSSNPDTFIIDIRYDGKLHVGGYHGQAYVDQCAESILKNPTINR